MKNKILDTVIKYIKTLIPYIIVFFLFITFIAQSAIVCGNSMNDTLNDGDLMVVSKIGRWINDRDYDRFSVIIFKTGKKEEPYYIKRIIGLPGEKVKIDENGNIYINDEILEENYGKEKITNPGKALMEIQLNDTEYFVLGDNRNNSNDSRFFGAVNKNQIVGRVVMRLLPNPKILDN